MSLEDRDGAGPDPYPPLLAGLGGRDTCLRPRVRRVPDGDLTLLGVLQIEVLSAERGEFALPHASPEGEGYQSLVSGACSGA